MNILSTNNSIENIEEILDKFKEFQHIISILRRPDGCPWDRKQTSASMRQHLLEEMHELIEAINNEDPDHVCEEIGDVILLLGMLTLIHSEKNQFDMAAVLKGLNSKLITRHPHVFGNSARTNDPDKAIDNWNTIKKEVEGRGASHTSILDGIPNTYTPLEKARKLQEKAAKNGFDWTDADGPKEKILEELDEIAHANNSDELENEIGDLFFAVANYARHLGCNSALSLIRANIKFEQRFRKMEEALENDGITISKVNLDVLDKYWEDAKKSES